MVNDSDEMYPYFYNIYKNNVWGGGSGGGSLPENTLEYRNFIIKFMKDNKIKTVIDYGCGDWQFSKLIDWSQYDYTGIDCVDFVIEKNINNYKSENINFKCLTKLSDFYNYKSDLLLIKEVMQHWHNDEIVEFLSNIRNNFKYILITNSSRQSSDNENEFSRSKPLSAKYKPIKDFDAEILMVYKGDGEKEISLISNIKNKII